MKKTFQITIGGQNFTIEEDAFNILSSYLDSLNIYFSKFEDNKEIINDIESRIAEKFYEMGLINGVIDTNHIEKIKTTIGSVDDFEDYNNEEGSDTKESDKNQVSSWYTDPERRLVGGVLAGIAHKYNWDVVWLRAFYLILLVGLFQTGKLNSSNFISFSWSGFFLIALYFLLLVIFPNKNNLKENPNLRKFYRDPENKMIAGVASGLAKYLNINVKVVRLIFILTSLVIFGAVIYVIIASVAPMADTVGKQLQLQGKAVNIENINLKIKETTQALGASTQAVIKTAPSIIENIFSFLGKLFRPVAGIIRVFTGVILLIFGMSIVFAAVLLLIVYFGIAASQDWISTGGINISYFTNEISNTGAVFGFFSLFIPGLVLSLLGVMLTIKRKIGNRNLWLVLIALWLMGMLGASTYIAKTVANFSNEDYIEDTIKVSDKAGKILTIEINDKSGDELFRPKYSLSLSENQAVFSTLRKSARGISRQEARTNARTILYNIEFEKDTLFLDENFSLESGTNFRDQDLNVDIQIPVNTKFRFGKNFNRRSSGPYNKFKIEGYEDYEASFRWRSRAFEQFNLSDYTFRMNADGEIVCLDCPEPKDYNKEVNEISSLDTLTAFKSSDLY